MAKPDYLVYAQVSEGKHWAKIGAGWKRVSIEKKEFISIQIDLLPLKFDGNIVIHTNDKE